MGIGTLYRHFPNRHALLDAMFRESVDELCARRSSCSESTDPYDAFVGWLHAQLQHAMTYQALAASLMISELSDDAPLDRCAASRPRAARCGATGEAQVARAQKLRAWSGATSTRTTCCGSSTPSR